MKILVLQDELFGYLQHVTRSYAQSGIEPDEGLAIYQLSQALKGAQNVSSEEMAKIRTGEFKDGTPLAVVGDSEFEIDKEAFLKP